MYNIFETLARFCALVAGGLLTLITGLTCASIIGREVAGATVPGDFELVALATGAVVGLFMPLCQLHRGNIMVEFFTARLPHRVNEKLDRVGALWLSLSFFLLTWRTGLGGLDTWHTNSTTMLLGFPEWTAYITMVPGFLLTAVIAMYQFLFGFGQYAGGHHAGEPTP